MLVLVLVLVMVMVMVLNAAAPCVLLPLRARCCRCAACALLPLRCVRGAAVGRAAGCLSALLLPLMVQHR
eukprot:COSAG02_NODE_3499_length_6650_cov_6.806136_4_plen_70_part_00